jgi:cell division protein FtsB
MYPETESRRGGVGGAIFSIVAIALLAYLSLMALQGEHGLFSLFRTESEEARLQAELDQIRADRAAIANKTHRLSYQSLDLDLLDEQARRGLGLGQPDEIIIR